MDLWQLHIFCKVVEHNSFSKAGEAAHLSQPTVSSHIRDLENHFGCRLIDRLGREAIPTKAGTLLYQYAKRLIALRDETETALSEFIGKIKGHLIIGGSTIPGGYILPQIIADFSRTYPEVTVSLRIGDTETIIRDTLEGILELSVVGAKTANKKIQQENLIEDEMRLVIPSDHPWAKRKRIHIEELRKEPFITREHGSGTLASIQHSLSKRGLTIQDFNIVAEMGSTESVRQGIKSRIGISILSAISVAEDVQNGVLEMLPVEGLDLKRSFYLTTHRNRTLTLLGGAFSDFMKNNLKGPRWNLK